MTESYDFRVIRTAILIAAAALVWSCAPTGRAAGAPTEPVTSPPATASSTPSPNPAPAPTLENPRVTASNAAFPIVTAFALRALPIDEALTNTVRASIERYLVSLDTYRDTAPAERTPGMLPVQGRFAQVVIAGMDASATPGVKRKFNLHSFHILSVLAKPWGTLAVAEVNATIVDRAVDGSAPDQPEIGRLRLVGDRLAVADGWDAANGRWFNGIERPSPDAVRTGTQDAVGFLLRTESWLAGMGQETWYGPGATTPFQKARLQHLTSLDRTAAASRTFEDVDATIERFEGFAEIRDGLAYVRVTGSLVMVDTTGRASEQPFTRRVVVLLGQWGPEVVDEETSSGAWRSGGDLALAERDHNFA